MKPPTSKFAGQYAVLYPDGKETRHHFDHKAALIVRATPGAVAYWFDREDKVWTPLTEKELFNALRTYTPTPKRYPVPPKRKKKDWSIQ